MAGSKGKSGSVSDFLGDDDWMNEDDPSEEVPTGHRVAVAPSAAPAAAPVEPPPTPVEPPPVVVVPAPADAEPPVVVMPEASDVDGTPAGEAASAGLGEEPAKHDAVDPAAEPAWTPAPLGAWAAATPRAVTPPASVSTGWTAWLEATSAGTLASNPTVAAAWASVLPVIVAEAGSSPQDLVMASRLAFDLLGDVDAAAALLARAEGADGGALAA